MLFSLRDCGSDEEVSEAESEREKKQEGGGFGELAEECRQRQRCSLL